MPVVKGSKLNKLTSELIDAIDSNDALTNPKVVALLALSSAKSNMKTLKMQNEAIQFNAKVDMVGKRFRRKYQSVTCLDVCIFKNNKETFLTLFRHIINNSYLNQETKQEIFSSALGTAITLKRTKILEILLSANTFSLNKKIIAWKHENTDLPLNIAIATNNHDAISLLLAHGARSSICDSERRTALVMTRQLNFATREKILALLNCEKWLEQARKSYHKGDEKKVYEYLVRATQADARQVRIFLAKTAQKALVQVNQVSNDCTDYRYLKTFMLIFSQTLQPTLKQPAALQNYQDFLQDTVKHLLGAYDCKKKPSRVKNLFRDNEEKYLFLLNNFRFMDDVLETLLQMREGKRLTVESAQSSANSAACKEPAQAPKVTYLCNAQLTPEKLRTTLFGESAKKTTHKAATQTSAPKKMRCSQDD